MYLQTAGLSLEVPFRLMYSTCDLQASQHCTKFIAILCCQRALLLRCIHQAKIVYSYLADKDIVYPHVLA